MAIWNLVQSQALCDDVATPGAAVPELIESGSAAQVTLKRSLDGVSAARYKRSAARQSWRFHCATHTTYEPP